MRLRRVLTSTEFDVVGKEEVGMIATRAAIRVVRGGVEGKKWSNSLTLFGMLRHREPDIDIPVESA